MRLPKKTLYFDGPAPQHSSWKVSESTTSWLSSLVTMSRSLGRMRACWFGLIIIIIIIVIVIINHHDYLRLMSNVT